MKKFVLPSIVTLIWTVVSVIFDRTTFTVPVMDMLHNYIPCRIIMMAAVFFMALMIQDAVLVKDSFSRKVLLFGLIYFIPIILVLFYKLPEGFLSNDESLIYAEALALSDYTWFYYITTWYYIVSLMIIPSWMGPIIIKVVIQCLTAGYVVARTHRYMSGRRLSFFMYIPFFLPPILAYTTSAHRIPIYIFLYVYFMFSIYMDKLEKAGISIPRLIPKLFLLAVLTQWRTEGIYLAFFGLIMIIICYRFDKKDILRLVVISFLIQYLTAVPQYGLIPNRMGDKAANRMLPFYAYTVTNMYRNGLDVKDPANAASLEKVDRYLNVETIAAINDYLGDINYEDALILYYQGYDGRRENATDEDYAAFIEGVKELMLNNKDVLMKTKWGSFDYAATVYDPVIGQGIPSLVVSLVKMIAYNLYIPMLLLTAGFIWSLCRIKERAFFVMLSLCLFAHFSIVFILAPASYFKYYFPVYFTVYFFAVLLVVSRVFGVKTLSEKPVDG